MRNNQEDGIMLTSRKLAEMWNKLNKNNIFLIDFNIFPIFFYSRYSSTITCNKNKFITHTFKLLNGATIL